MCYNIRQQLIDKIFETENLCFLISDEKLEQMVRIFSNNNIKNVGEFFDENWKNYYMKGAKFIFTTQQLMDYCIKFEKCKDKQDFCNWFLEMNGDYYTLDEFEIWKKVILEQEGRFYLIYPFFIGNKLRRIKFHWEKWHTSPAYYPEYAKQHLSENSVKTKG